MEKNKEELIKMVPPLLKWYQVNKLDLPWRKSKNPYHIWVSEIMLQQTRIEAVKKYYVRFLKELPTVKDLADISEERLLKLWEGLGYYSRARNLKKAAEIIQFKYQGNMPQTYEELCTLPGIGEYTAGAIASIAYNEKVPAVDGNVLRVISRVLASRKDVLEPATKKEITGLLLSIMPKESGDFNEALMELGERVCLPKDMPLCSQCPISSYCKAKTMGLTGEIPVRKSKLKRTEEEKTVGILCNQEEKVAIRKRLDKGLLSGMYEFPNWKGKQSPKVLQELLYKEGYTVLDMIDLGEYQHVFTHKDWNMKGYMMEIQQNEKSIENDWLWVSAQELEETYALPTAFQVFWKRARK